MTKWQAIWQVIRAGGWVQVLGTLASIGVTVGLLTVDQVQAILQAAAGAQSLILLVATVVSTFRHADAVLQVQALRSAQVARDVAGT